MSDEWMPPNVMPRPDRHEAAKQEWDNLTWYVGNLLVNEMWGERVDTVVCLTALNAILHLHGVSNAADTAEIGFPWCIHEGPDSRWPCETIWRIRSVVLDTANRKVIERKGTA